jgi:hypothetical protein
VCAQRRQPTESWYCCTGISGEKSDRFERGGWGAKVVEQLSGDLKIAFPDMKGFSLRNLRYMRAFAEAWPDREMLQQAAATLPWPDLSSGPVRL